MAYASATFAEWGRSDFLGDDGAAYRAAVEVDAWAFAPVDLGPFAREALEVTQAPLNAGQRLDVVTPIYLTSATLSLHTLHSTKPHLSDGLLSLAALPPGSVRLRVLRSEDGTAPEASDDAAWELAYCLYLVPDGMSDSPGRSLVPTQLNFEDGWRLLLGRAFLQGLTADYDPGTGEGDEESVLAALMRILAPLEGGGGGLETLTTQCDLYPYVAGDAVDEETNPLEAIRILRASLLDPDSGDTVDQAEAVRVLTSRFLLRLTQARGGWVLTSPALLAAKRGLALPTHVYDLSTGAEVGIRGGNDTVASVVAADGSPGDGYDLIDSLEDSVTGATREAESAYAFAPEITNAVLNASFEIAGDTAPEARYWSLDPGSGTASAVREQKPLADRVVGDEWWIALQGEYDDETEPSAYQEGQVYLPGSPGGRITVGVSQVWDNYDVGTVTTPPRLRVRTFGGTAEHQLEAFTVVVTRGTLKGSDTTVAIEPLYEEATAGEPRPVLVAPGTVFKFVGAEFTVTAPARLGDTELVGNADAAIPNAGTATAYAWEPAADHPFPTTGIEVVESGGFYIRATMEGTDGRLVGGYPSVLYTAPLGATDPGAPGVPPKPLTYLDRVRFAVTYAETAASGDGKAPSRLVSRASLTAGSHGAAVAIPPGSDVYRHGDGPLPTSRTRLRVEGDSGAVYDTAQGELTAWQHGAWGTDAPSAGEGPGLDALCARDTLRLLVGHAGGVGGGVVTGTGERRLSFDVRLRPKASGDAPALLTTVGPIRIAVEGYVQQYAPTGSTSLVTSRAPTPGASVVIDARGKNGDPETIASATSAADVFPGGFTVPLASATTRPHYPGERVWVCVLVLPTSIRSALGTGRASGVGTALALADPAGFIEETILST